jgi:myo-inositol 2-dehydrogenase/D-chiro-inositol 1-dehydrogenase
MTAPVAVKEHACIRVGILGAGNMGSLHAGILANDPRVRIVTVADREPERAENLARRLNARPCADLKAILAEGIDALYVTTPNTTHVEPTIQALGAGVHVFCEKPFACSLSDARRIVKAAARSNAVYQGGHNRRFAPAYLFLKERIEEGFAPYLINVKMNDGDLKDPPWLSDRRKTGGFLFETTIHLLDIALWLMGDAVEVKAEARDNLYPDLVDWAILLTFRGGGMGTVISSGHASWHPPTERVEIVGDHATILSEGLDSATCSPGPAQVVESRNFLQFPREQRWGYVQEEDAFIRAVRGEVPSAFNVKDGFRIVQLVEACYRSAESGRSVRLER